MVKCERVQVIDAANLGWRKVCVSIERRERKCHVMAINGISAVEWVARIEE